MTKSIKDFITGKVTYIPSGQCFWINNPEGGMQMLLEMRGWGAIQNLFANDEKGLRDSKTYQDKIAHWIADAINEKLEREH